MSTAKRPVTDIALPLVQWYKAHERSFPWRRDPSPYRVWVSEIMLQQTRIEAALPYFERFMETLPTVQDLAQADEDVLMKLWEGLGYYSRVRNLQKAARRIMEDFNGELPNTYEELLTLPGIGDYTAGAIASIVFGQRVAAVDGNVLRVMARLLDEDGDVMKPVVRKRLSSLVHEIVPAQDPSAFNQGLMELGETICLPNAMPRCSQCPIHDCCAVAGTERAAQLPTRAAPKPRKVENRTVLLVITQARESRVLLHRRDKKGLLSGMWEFPNFLDGEDKNIAQLLTKWGARFVNYRQAPTGKHVFSHVEWILSGRIAEVEPFDPPADHIWVSKNELESYALPTAFRLYAELLTELL